MDFISITKMGQKIEKFPSKKISSQLAQQLSSVISEAISHVPAPRRTHRPPGVCLHCRSPSLPPQRFSILHNRSSGAAYDPGQRIADIPTTAGGVMDSHLIFSFSGLDPEAMPGN